MDSAALLMTISSRYPGSQQRIKEDGEMKVKTICIMLAGLLLATSAGVIAGQETATGTALTGYFVDRTAHVGEAGPLAGLPAEEDTAGQPPVFADLPVISEKLLEQVSAMDPEELIKVIILLRYQPQGVISKEVCEKHRPEMDRIRQRIKAINAPYAAQRKLDAPYDAENYLDPALKLNVDDREALRAVTDDHEALSLVVRDEIAGQLREELKESQESVTASLERLGGSVEFAMLSINALVASVPVPALEKVAALELVARIDENGETEGLLNIADNATRVTDMGGLWEYGLDGGAYDPAVCDTGIDRDHLGLDDETGRSNFYTWYLVEGSTDMEWDDIFSEYDIHGHGTHVMGIVASMGTVDYPSHRGMAHGVQKTVTLKAGYNRSNGRSLMFRTDAMYVIDRALYNTDALRPQNTFNDEVDGLNLSFGADTLDDDSSYARFYDAFISTFPDILVTISAGNDGPDNYWFSDPAIASNPIAVAIVDDQNTVTRTDDLIDPMSSRGPTSGSRRKPDISAPGTWISSCNNNWEFEDDYVSYSGTSMAAPMVQGIAMDLMDAGVSDELDIKALLINTAQKNDGAIDFENDSDGWDPAYGWGYMNALAAYHHRDDIFHDTVTPYPDAGHYHLYRGQMRDEGSSGEGRDRATMVWNRQVTYEPHEYPLTWYETSNLNLYLFEEADNTLHDYDNGVNEDNVAQVRIDSGAGLTDVIITALAYESSFDHGGATEEFALATEEGFVEVDMPATFLGWATWPLEVEPNEVFDLTYWMTNNSEIPSHHNAFNLQLPPGWSLVSGDDPYYPGTMAGGGGTSSSVVWRLQAQPTPEEDTPVGVDHSHNSYFVAWGDYRWDIPVDVRWDTTPPSPTPAWNAVPYALSNSQIQMFCTESSDLHEPVTYYFDYVYSPTGGAGGSSSGWTFLLGHLDSGLAVNHQYGYAVAARDSAQTPNVTPFTATYYVFTLANTPGTPTVTNPTPSSLDVTISDGGNPYFTHCAIWVDSVGGMVDEYYLNASGGSNGTTPFFQSIANWGTVTATGLDSGIEYGFTVKARNGDNIDTGWSPFGLGTTTTPSTDTVAASITCIPSTGTVPFTTQMTVTLENLYSGMTRRMAGRIDVTLGGGASVSNWRSGYTNIAAGDSFVTAWNNNIPAVGRVIGSNQFVLVVEDVTPAPYNQPPYPAAGDTDTSACTVVASAP